LPFPTAVLALFMYGLFLLQQPENQAPATQSTSQEQEENQKTPAPSSATPPKEQVSTQSPKTLKQEAWDVLQAGVNADKKEDRAAAVHATGLIPNDSRARKIAEAAVKDDTPEVRAAAAAALGDMQSRMSIPSLKLASDDQDPAVALAAAHSLLQLNDDAGYEVYYEILTGERKMGKGVLAQAAAFKDPKKLADIGFHEVLGFVPFGGISWQAFTMVRKKGDSSPARAAAATVLAKDRDPKTTRALLNAVGDKNWIIRAAALQALGKGGDFSVLNTVELYLSDDEGDVKYIAAELRFLMSYQTAKV
jgi:HEAT repeat protein